jgi:hypothetical protein
VLPDAAPDFSATLVWTDPAGSPTAARALVNDLDLSVTDRCGETVRGNRGAEGAAEGAAGGADRVNTVERVQLRGPGPDGLGGARAPAGCEAPSREVRVRVAAVYVPVGAPAGQPFAIAVASAAVPCGEAPSRLAAAPPAAGRVAVDLYASAPLDALRPDCLRGALARALRVPSRAVLILRLNAADRSARASLDVDAVLAATADPSGPEAGSIDAGTALSSAEAHRQVLDCVRWFPAPPAPLPARAPACHGASAGSGGADARPRARPAHSEG